MLRGFAFECLFKAIYLKQGNKLVVNGKMDIPKELKNHDLNKMAKKLKFNFNEDEKFYLDILTYFSKNLGRYPITKIDNPEQFFLEKIKKSSKKKRKISFIVESDYIVINRIKDILLDKLHNI